MSALKVGMIGAGGISRSHLPGWRTLDKEIGVEVKVFSDVGAPELVAEVGFGQAVDSLDDLLKWCDIVDVVTPTYTHAALVERALHAGKNVICEKPMALTADDARRLANLAHSVGKGLIPAHVVRYFPQYAGARQAVLDGKIGEVAIARFERNGSFPGWADWFADDELSGGLILDLMIHDLDIARWICGEVTQVYATLSRVTDEKGNDQATAQVVLTHDSGAISYVGGVWGPPTAPFCTTFHLSGSKGIIGYDSRKDSTVSLDLQVDESEDSAVMLPDLSTIESPYLTELRDYVRALDTGEAARVTAADGVSAVALAEAAIHSAATGEPVDVASIASSAETEATK